MFYRDVFVRISRNPELGGPPLVGNPLMLIHFIRSYQHIGSHSPIRNLRTRYTVVTGTYNIWYVRVRGLGGKR